MNHVQRLEFDDGKSSKFWEAEVREEVLITRWGKIGSKGQIKEKKFDNSWFAKAEMKKQIEAKMKKGYQRAKTALELELEQPPPKAAKRNKEMEAVIAADPSDPEPWTVYADWLQGEGDPRGELIAVQHALEKKKDKKLRDREATIFEEHGALLLGPLRKHMKTLDHRQSDVFTWRRGFLDSVRISYNSYAVDDQPFDAAEFLADILKHPSAALLREIVLAEINTGKWSDKHGSSQVYQPLIDAIAKAKPKTIRSLVVGEYDYPNDTEISWTWIGSLGKIWSACPRLESLRVQGGSIELGKIEAPELRSAAFVTGGLAKSSVQSIAAAKWPKLERLEIWFGSRDYGAGGELEDIMPILEGKGLTSLKHLALKNCEFADELATVVGKSKVLARLDTLDLSMSILGDEGAQALSATAKSFAHLSMLDLSDCYLSKASVEAVKRLAKKVSTNDQRDADDWDGEQHRYVAVGE